MKNLNKIIINIPLIALIIMPTFVFATEYENTTESVEYREQDLTQDYDNTADETKVDVLVVQASSFSVSIPKRIVLNGSVTEANDADYTIKVSGNIASNEVISVIPANTFKMYDENGIMPALDTTVTQNVTKFVDEALKNSKYPNATDTIFIKTNNDGDVGTTTGNVEVHELTSGSWSGIFNFEIKLKSIKPITHNITLSFDTNGEGEIKSQTKTVLSGESAEFKIPTVLDSDGATYRFEGWLPYEPSEKILDRNAPIPEELIECNTFFKTDKSITLYAIYRKTTTVTGGGGDNPDIQ